MNAADIINTIVEVEKRLSSMSESMKINFEGTPYQLGLVEKLDDALNGLELARKCLVKVVTEDE